MADLSHAEMFNKWAADNAQFATNNIGSVSEAKLRQFVIDANDSFRKGGVVVGPGGGNLNGSVYHAYWTMLDLVTKTFTLPADTTLYPDIKADMSVLLSVGGHIQVKGLDYSFTTRSITILGDFDPDLSEAGDLVYFIWDTGAGASAGGPSNTVSTQVGSQILIDESANEDGSINYDLVGDPKLVSNPVNAITPAIVGTLMFASNPPGNEIEAKDYTVYEELPVMDSVAKTPTSPGIGGLFSVHGGFLYASVADGVWVRVAVQTSW